MTEQEAIKWIDDRMCYGRYIPQKHNPFVHDECCQAGELAIKALEKQIELRKNCEGSCSDCKYRGEFQCANDLLIDAGDSEV